MRALPLSFLAISLILISSCSGGATVTNEDTTIDFQFPYKDWVKPLGNGYEILLPAELTEDFIGHYSFSKGSEALSIDNLIVPGDGQSEVWTPRVHTVKKIIVIFYDNDFKNNGSGEISLDFVIQTIYSQQGFDVFSDQVRLPGRFAEEIYNGLYVCEIPYETLARELQNPETRLEYDITLEASEIMAWGGGVAAQKELSEVDLDKVLGEEFRAFSLAVYNDGRLSTIWPGPMFPDADDLIIGFSK